jgi:hypothetical protein
MSSPDLLGRPDIWKPMISNRMERLHQAALDAEDAYAQAETRDSVRARRQARRAEQMREQYGVRR